MHPSNYFKTLVSSALVSFSLSCSKQEPQPSPNVENLQTQQSFQQPVQNNVHESSELVSRARRLEERLQNLAEDIENIHLLRTERTEEIKREYERTIENYQRICTTISRTNPDYRREEFPALEELLQTSEHTQIAQNIEKFKNAAADISEAVENLQNQRLPIRQFLRELRNYEGAHGRYLQALEILQNKKALPLLLFSPQSLLQLRWFTPALPENILALARNEPIHTEATYKNMTGNMEYGFANDEQGIRREYFNFISNRERQNRQIILIYSNGVLTRQTNLLLPDYIIREDLMPAAKFIELSTHPMLRQMICFPDELFEEQQKAETETVEHFIINTDEQANVAEEILIKIRSSQPVNLDFLNVQMMQETEGPLTNYMLGRMGLRPYTRLFRLTEEQNVRIYSHESDEINFEYETHTQNLRFIQGQQRGHVIQTVLINEQQIYTCDWYLQSEALNNARRTAFEDFDNLDIALIAQRQLQQMPEVPMTHVHLFESRCELMTEPQIDEETREHMLQYYLDLQVVAEHFEDEEQARNIKNVMERLARR
ncbi:MAG: hypothetical protein HY363_00835 [Candidatus Aenigmarchaeota archaeon]|nr:hypothetical protein [Candidatus Aenigmarchaeota archaeon]